MLAPKIGEIRKAKEIGRSGNASVIWLPCIDCGKERWVYLHKGEPTSKRCTPCRGKLDAEKNIHKLAENIKLGFELGKKCKHARYIKRICPDCGKEDWILRVRGKPANPRCRPCGWNRIRGSKSPNWKGGRKVTSEGYVFLVVQPDDFFFPMANKNHLVAEHRLVMAKHLGRCLHRWEIVHHKGTKYPKDSKENKKDNRIENLQLVTDERHQQITIMENRIKHLEARVTLLEAENALLKGLEVK